MKEFLDACDKVLNSNTFLLQTQLGFGGLREELPRFIPSPEFLQQLLQQDIERGWNNLHYYRDDDGPLEPKKGVLVKPSFELSLTRPAVTPKEYFMGMLMGNTRIGNFCSFYGPVMSRIQAELLAEEFIGWLTAGQFFELYTLEPNFLEETADLDTMCYFEPNGCNTATVVVCGRAVWLLLTNGIP